MKIPPRMCLADCAREAGRAHRRAERSELALRGKLQSSTVPDLPEWLWGQPAWPTEDQLTFKDAFRRVGIVRAIVNLVATDAASLPKRFFLGDAPDPLPRAPGNVVDVWEAANARDTGYERTRDLHGDFEIGGNAYLFLERGLNAPPTRPPFACWPIKPHLLAPAAGPNRTISHYVYSGAGAWENLEPWKIVHFKDYSGDDELRGVGWLEAGRDDWMAAFYAIQLMRQFFFRGGVSPGTWALKEGTRPLGDKDIKAMQQAYARRFQTTEKNWLLVIVQGLEQIAKGQTVSELQLGEMLNLVKADMCNAAGVPPWMLGVYTGGNLSQGPTSAVSAETYWRSTIGSRVGLFDAVLNERFCPLFGRGIRVATDFSAVPALQQARLEMHKSALAATGRPVLTVNEARQDIKRTPYTDDPTADELYLPQRTPIPAETPAAPPAPPAQQQRLARLMALGREALARQADANLHRYEAVMAALWRALFDEQQAAALADLRRQIGREAAGDVDLGAFDPTLTPAQRARLKRELERVMAERGAEAAALIGQTIALDIYAAAVQSYINARVAVMIRGTTETTRADLREKIGEVVARQGSYDEIAEAVRRAFDGRRANALTIARTEVSAPYNQAQWMVWKEGGVARKFWVTMNDEAVRRTHRTAGERYAEARSIPIDEEFIVGGHATQVPGATGDPGEDINCRCQTLPDLEDYFSAGEKSAIRRGAPWWDSIAARNGKAPELEPAGSMRR